MKFQVTTIGKQSGFSINLEVYTTPEEHSYLSDNPHAKETILKHINNGLATVDEYIAFAIASRKRNI